MNATVEKTTRGKSVRSFFRNFLRKRGNLVIFVFIWLVAMIFIKNFATLANNTTIIKQAAIPAITCLGMTLVLMTGGIDLSLGYMVGLCSYIFGMLVNIGVPTVVALLITMACGGICGLLNGALVQFVKIPAFIVTLGTGYILYGLSQIISNGSAITNFAPEVLAIGKSEFLGLPATVYIAIVVVIACYFLMHRSTFGRSLSALGYNMEASRLSGINTAFINVMVYVLCGVLAALSAGLMTVRVNQATPTMGGTTYTFEAITAAILGGASLFGGVGSAFGSVFGVLTIMIIENCVNLLNINYYFYQAVLGIVILAAIIFENLKNRALQ
jgi:ribose transport system permease protein